MSLSEIHHIIAHRQHRMSWDDYFMSSAYLASARSPDERLQVGCVIVKDNHIISSGYNGFLPKLPHRSFIENGHEQATVHAEQNCVSDCARRGQAMNGAIAYVTHYPCINCFKILVASGIQDIIYHEDYRNHDLVNKLSQLAKISIIQLQSYESNKVENGVQIDDEYQKQKWDKFKTLIPSEKIDFRNLELGEEESDNERE